MRKCLGCGKKLGWLEGYSSDEEEWCNDCYPKKDMILKKKEHDTKEEKPQKATYKENKFYKQEKERQEIIERIKLEKTIEQGKWNFVLTKGALYGGFMFLFMTFFMWLFMGEFFESRDIIFNLVPWEIAGLIFGLWYWSAINKKFENETRK